MRITSLHLQAYGHFTGCSLDFGRAPCDPPGLHLVYGHNEAGKSTTLRALSSVLFGYPHGVIDGFKHDAKDIAIGIDLLAADGRTLSFVRRRRGKRALTAADGSALEEGVVEDFLGGVSRDVFEKVFALDHHRLREHAKALLADGGSLGFSLAEAGSGIAGLKAVLDRLRTERAGLFLAAGTRPRLNQAIAEFVRLRKEARQHTVSPSAYRGYEKRIRETDAELLRMRERRKAIEAGIVRLERIRKNLPLRAEHRALTQRIATLDGVPVLPPEFAEVRIKASADLDVATADLAIASSAIADLEQRIAAIAVDGDILSCSEDIEKAASKRPVIERQETECPRWEAERAQLVATAAELMAKAELGSGRPGVAGQLPPPVKRKVIQNLAEDGKELKVKLATALEHADSAARSLKKARDRAAGMSRPRPVDELSRALTAADRLGADITSDIAKRSRALERKTKALNDALASLGLAGNGRSPPAAGAGVASPDQGADRIAFLRELAVPSEKTEARYAALVAGLEGKLKKARDDIERLSGERADIDGRIAALRTAGDVATEDDLKAARDIRDRGWALVRGVYVDRKAGFEDAGRCFAPDGRIADAYETHVREADRAVDTLRARVKESTELAFLKQKAADLTTQQIDLS
ncbi:MAG: AAA family ATPase, partial [Bradyrhizobiaceae bacterium]|nr:AAA family ATPase [Bradyrhizobiaceae bacterium]